MKNVILSQRLLMSASYVNSPDSVVADVGCDHAHTGIWLVKEGRAGRAIGMDVRKGPLEKAHQNILLYGCEDRVELRLSDGLDGLTPGEAQTIIIAGMGGVLMKDILSRGEAVAAAAHDLVLQPQSHIDEVRLWLSEHGFAILDEDMCLEDGKYYLTMHAAHTGTIYSLSDAELLFGPVMIGKRGEVFDSYVKDSYEKSVKRIAEITQSDTDAASDKASQFVRIRNAAEVYLGYFLRTFRCRKDGFMERNCKVTYNGLVLEYAAGTKYGDIAAEFASEYDNDIILALVDGHLQELNKSVKGDCEIKFVTAADKPGMATYKRGVIFLMLRAFTRVFDAGQIEKICVEHTIGDSLFCTVKSSFELTQEYLTEVKKEMQRIVSLDLPIGKVSVKTRDARKLFLESGMSDKEKLLRFRRVSNTNLYDLDGYVDYFYGYMPASTGILKYFDLMLYDDGFLINLPDSSNPKELREFVDKPKFFKTQRESNSWGQKIGIETVGDLNEAISRGNISDLILVQEAAQEHNIAKIAEMIKERGDSKFVMIAGPSSSGKTTFSHRLSIQLRTLGLKPHPIALDNYFKNREDTPKDEDGNYNFECLGAIDIEGFNKDMTELRAGKEVDMRVFNFKTGRSEYKGNYLKLGRDDVLVLEGIHGLNDALSYSLPTDSKFKVYISALTQLNIDEHNRIPTTDGRLIRRMVRDARTRGTSAKNTIAMWPSVRRGEEENIFPFQEQADVMFNSALIYELSVLKQYAEPLLFGIPEDCPEYMEAKRLLKFLDYFLGVSSEEIPHNSIVREFVGGSVFPV